MAVYCSLDSNPEEFSGYRSFEFYQSCNADCTCSAFELMCLQRQTDETKELGYYFTLESHNHEYAEECKEKRECICNTNKELWVANPQVIGDYALPDPLLVPIQHYDKLLAEAREDTAGLDQDRVDEIIYKRNIFAELSGGHQRADKFVAHEINGVENLPDYKLNDEVLAITDNCVEQVTCDLHYELDWNFRLRADLTCDYLAQNDPCFGTFACICDNGYVKVAVTMPERPESYKGRTEELIIVE